LRFEPIVEAFKIPSGSMEDTLLIGDLLFINKFIYGIKIPYTDIRLPALKDPKPGDIEEEISGDKILTYFAVKRIATRTLRHEISLNQLIRKLNLITCSI